MGLLNMPEFSKGEAMESKKKKKKRGTMCLLKKMLKDESFELSYTEHNKPFLLSRKEHISISHSHDKLAIILNKTENTGIDIELIRDKVRKVQHKFLNKRELLFANNNVERLITLWAAKEALYKVYGLKGLDFMNNIFISDFEGSVLFGKIETIGYNKEYQMVCEKLEDYILVYILNEV